MAKMICDACGYNWETRIEKPKKCAKCLRWIKYNDENNSKKYKSVKHENPINQK